MHLILKCTYIPAVTQRKHTESNCWHFILKNLSRQFLFPFIWKLLVKCFRFLRIHQIPFRCCILSGNSIQIPGISSLHRRRMTSSPPALQCNGYHTRLPAGNHSSHRNQYSLQSTMLPRMSSHCYKKYAAFLPRKWLKTAYFCIEDVI